MKRGKKAQFYIIGAVIIIIAMMGLASVSNYVLTKEEPKKFIGLGDTLNREGEKVIENAIYQGNKEYLKSKMGNFSTLMSNYIALGNEQVNLVIIQGNSSNAQVTVISQNSTGTITLNTGGTTFTTESFRYHLNTTDVKGKKVNVTLLNTTYPFELGDDEEFMFVMTKNEGFEQYVISKGAI
jgi:hypothetical protein